MKIEDIAKVCHEANRALCAGLGDNSQLSWEDAPAWQRDSAINGVQFNLDNPAAPASASHDSWLAQKRSEGVDLRACERPREKGTPLLCPI